MGEGYFDGLALLWASSALFASFIIFTTIAAWILCIILFFKVWKMTNDVSSIRDSLEEWLDIEHPLIESRTANVNDGAVKSTGSDS